MASVRGILRAAAAKLHADYRQRECITFGTYWGYPFLIKGGSFSDSRANIRILLCVNERLFAFRPLLPKGWQMNDTEHMHEIIMPVKGSTKAAAKTLIDFLDKFLIALESNHVQPCDAYGGTGEIGFYRMKGSYVFLTPENAQRVELALGLESAKAEEVPENVPMGLLGALGFGVLASLLILVIARFGAVTSLSSALFGVAIVYGYKWKGKHISKVSSLICMILGTLLGYLTFRLDLALDLHKALPELDIPTAFLHGRELMELADAMDTYYGNFVLLFGIGVLSVIISLVVQHKEKHEQFAFQQIT